MTEKIEFETNELPEYNWFGCDIIVERVEVDESFDHAFGTEKVITERFEFVEAVSPYIFDENDEVVPLKEFPESVVTALKTFVEELPCEEC